MSVKSELSRLEAAKQSIRDELNKMGMEIPESTKLDSYASYISSYRLNMQTRIEALESKEKQALYFKNANSYSSLSDIENLENKALKKIYLKG